MRLRFYQVTCFLLVLLYLYTAASKFLDIDRFYRDLRNQPFPDDWTSFLVVAIPVVELLIAVSLFFDSSRLLALYASLTLMTLFTIYTALVLLHVFPYVPCSCGGVIESLSWPQHLVFNLFFVFITVISIWFHKRLVSTGKTMPALS